MRVGYKQRKRPMSNTGRFFVWTSDLSSLTENDEFTIEKIQNEIEDHLGCLCQPICPATTSQPNNKAGPHGCCDQIIQPVQKHAQNDIIGGLKRIFSIERKIEQTGEHDGGNLGDDEHGFIAAVDGGQKQEGNEFDHARPKTET